MCDAPMVSVSIVSHGQGALISPLLSQLAECEQVRQVILTRNLPGDEIVVPDDLSEHVCWIDNVEPKGFAANHNQAARRASEPYLCVLNPDIRFEGNPFPRLIDALTQTGESCALVAPLVRSPAGGVEDSVRRYPTLIGLGLKLFGISDGRVTVNCENAWTDVDWVAGMFMLFRVRDFRHLGGFDGAFFMYYEDVDLCERFHRAGGTVRVCPQVAVIHEAQRASRRNFRHMRWHLSSMARYFRKYPLRLISERL